MEPCKLRLESKRLISGKIQVKFSAEGFRQECYGYVLTEPKSSLREVVERIGRHVNAMQYAEKYYQRNLFSVGNRKDYSGKVLIFKNP